MGVRARLEVQGLTKDFSATRALDNVNILIQPGEVHAVLGQNGAGKSTLVKILAGGAICDVAVFSSKPTTTTSLNSSKTKFFLKV